MNFERRRWIYMASAMVLALCSGIGYAWSVFQKPLMGNLNCGLKAISFTFTIQILISTIAPVFLGKYQKTLGVGNYLRIGIGFYVIGLAATMFTNTIGYLYIVYGIVVGIGIAMLYPTLMSYSTSLFPDKTGLASGILACSYGSGAVLWAPIATLFMKKHGVLAVFGLFAVIFAVVMIPTSFLIKNVPENFNERLKKVSKTSNNVVGNMDYTWREMLKTSTYYILVITLTLGATAGLMVMGHASTILQEVLKYTAERAALLVGLFSVFNSFGRFIFGFVSDRFGRYNVMMFLFAVIGGAMILLTKSSGIIFVAALLIISACYGGFTSMFSPVCADNFGLKNLSVNYPFLYVAYGLAGAIGPQLAARIKTVSGGYNLAFLTVTGMSVLGFFLVLFLKSKKKLHSKYNF
ncbi:OFA family MFS transporter [Caloramator sp. E03]|uniref:L-lactate MFS transporter n=1 Tax=Caloramator sp. E03 TaxID=2576307 RepID=UPI001110B159|nr:OFA family MFS transporter [Caloramator sp. E03]QCX33887.1 OFA family MFS transporter [Caloramator sp. E03]